LVICRIGGRQEGRAGFEDGHFGAEARHTLPSSRPITPEPITPSFFGAPSKAQRAVVVADHLCSSNGSMPGR
jgi:hypothetical protein